MKKGVFARILLPDSFPDACKRISDCGYSAIHLNLSSIGTLPMPPEISQEQMRLIKDTVSEFALEVVGLSGTFNIIHPDSDYRISYKNRFEILKQVAVELGIPMISLCTGTRNTNDKWTFHPDNNSKEAWTEMIHALEQLVDIVDGTNIKLGIEPEVGNVVNTTAKASNLIREMASDHLKIIFDPANLFEEAKTKEVEYLIESGLDLLGDHLIMVHIKDRAADGKFTTPGKGIIPFDFLLDKVKTYKDNLPVVAHGFNSSDLEYVGQFLDDIIHPEHLKN